MGFQSRTRYCGNNDLDNCLEKENQLIQTRPCGGKTCSDNAVKGIILKSLKSAIIEIFSKLIIYFSSCDYVFDEYFLSLQYSSLQIVLLSALMGGHAGQTEIVFVPKVTKENSAKKVLR